MGKMMSEIKPRHAVAYHSFDELLPSVRDGIRETYDGPLSMATDMMVWNITKDAIVERMTVSPDRAWSVEGPTPQPPPEPGRPDPISDSSSRKASGARRSTLRTVCSTPTPRSST